MQIDRCRSASGPPRPPPATAPTLPTARARFLPWRAHCRHASPNAPSSPVVGKTHSAVDTPSPPDIPIRRAVGRQRIAFARGDDRRIQVQGDAAQAIPCHAACFANRRRHAAPNTSSEAAGRGAIASPLRRSCPAGASRWPCNRSGSARGEGNVRCRPPRWRRPSCFRPTPRIRGSYRRAVRQRPRSAPMRSRSSAQRNPGTFSITAAKTVWPSVQPWPPDGLRGRSRNTPLRQDSFSQAPAPP